jgi:hypothetical protein
MVHSWYYKAWQECNWPPESSLLSLMSSTQGWLAGPLAILWTALLMPYRRGLTNRHSFLIYYNNKIYVELASLKIPKSLWPWFKKVKRVRLKNVIYLMEHKHVLRPNISVYDLLLVKECQCTKNNRRRCTFYKKNIFVNLWSYSRIIIFEACFSLLMCLGIITICILPCSLLSIVDQVILTDCSFWVWVKQLTKPSLYCQFEILINFSSEKLVK